MYIMHIIRHLSMRYFGYFHFILASIMQYTYIVLQLQCQYNYINTVILM